MLGFVTIMVAGLTEIVLLDAMLCLSVDPALLQVISAAYWAIQPIMCYSLLNSFWKLD